MNSDGSKLVAPAEIPHDVREAWREKGWPEDLVERAYGLRVRRVDIDGWLRRGKGHWRGIRKQLDQRERLIGGTLRVREATWNDNEALADLYANSPEGIGDWQITVERSPYPFAEFRLQENVSILVIEDRGVILAAVVHSARNTVVGGKRVTVQIEYPSPGARPRPPAAHGAATRARLGSLGYVLLPTPRGPEAKGRHRALLPEPALRR